MPHEHPLWIDRLSGRLGLRAWPRGVLAIGLASYLVFIVAIATAGTTAGLADIAIYGLLFFAPLTVGSVAASVYVRDKMVGLEAYAMSMVDDPEAAADALKPLSRLRPVALIAVGMFIAFIFPYFLQPGLLVQLGNGFGLFLTLLPWLLAIWMIATALWVLGFSLVGIYRIGKLPMRLQSFTKDRALGLRPFASTCLRLTAIYYGLVSFTILSDLDTPFPLWYVVGRSLGFLLLGIPLLLLPLLSLHEKLVRAKAEKAAWINEHYTRVVARLEANADGGLDAATQGELLGIDKIQRDIHSIRTWPLDISSLAKFVTIFLSVTAILLSRVIAARLGI